MKKCILVGFLVIGTLSLLGCAGKTFDDKNTTDVGNDVEGDDRVENESCMYITIGNQKFEVSLEDNETVKELASRLPLRITMKDLNANEKYYYFDTSLPSKPIRVSKINAGDVMLYGDDCLVLFYDTFSTSYSYTRIGRIEMPDDIKNSIGAGDIDVYISK